MSWSAVVRLWTEAEDATVSPRSWFTCGVKFATIAGMDTPSRLNRFVPILLLLPLLACSGGRGGNTSPTGGRGTDTTWTIGGTGGTVPAPVVGGPSVDVTQTVQGLAPEASAFAALGKTLEQAAKTDAPGLLSKYPAAKGTLGYDPLASSGLDKIQASDLRLNEAELKVLGEKGLVFVDRQRFPTFLRGYAAVYHQHLPVFVSADAMLDAVHRSYDAILMQVEYAVLVPSLERMLREMRTRLAVSPALPQTKADADLYLAVALSLLTKKIEIPVAGAKLEDISTFVPAALAADGLKELKLFDVERVLDFSQFKPRGHYDDQESGGNLHRYFRSMMWLGRVDMRLIETLPDGKTKFRPQQFKVMLLLWELMNENATKDWNNIDSTVRLFVGESDYMTVPQVAALVADLGGLASARAASDEAVASAIIKGGYGAQKIASHFMVNDGTVPTLPLNRSFLIFGQRYVVDSDVFSNVVYDRLPGKRMMPNPLDVGFAVLQNNGALGLNTDLASFGALPGALAKMRVLVDSNDSSFWSANLYNLWLHSLRELSPSVPQTGLPVVASTEAWNLRILNAQLGSWAQLRHDTLLYAKQSYSGVPVCEFPDAYVEPYPEFFAALGRYASAGVKVVDLFKELPPTYLSTAEAIQRYFQNLSNTANMLQGMATAQREGRPFSDEQMAFINNAVNVESKIVGCVPVEVPNGWYADLFFERDKSIEEDLTIADVHTQPADAGGVIVGKVLHVGTAYPRLSIITANTCQGTRAYVGMAFSYHETTTDQFLRLTDREWTASVKQTPPASPAWLSPVVAP
jgi:Protein of unknown function (DUF3160)